MSRIAKQPIKIPENVTVTVNGLHIGVKGPKGTLEREVHADVVLQMDAEQITIGVANEESWSFAGTERSLINNMVLGVVNEFQKKLELVGVGYRAQVKGDKLSLNLGFSHDINFPIPGDLTIQTPSQTEVLVSGIDKQKVGQAAAEIRAFRPPEPYKGKGVKYSDERIRRKEVKKK